MLLARAIRGIPHHDTVDRCARFTYENRTDQDWCPDRTGCSVQSLCRIPIHQRIYIRSIFGPDNKPWPGCATRRDIGSELLGAGNMIIEHRSALGVEIEAESRHVALNDGSSDDLVRGGTGRTCHQCTHKDEDDGNATLRQCLPSNTGGSGQ